MDRRLLVLAFALAAALSTGFALKSTCFLGDFNHLAYHGLCYSDIPPLYKDRHLDRDAFPYVDHGDEGPLDERRGFVEYPVLTGLFMWTIAAWGTLRRLALPIGPESYWEYFNWTALALSFVAFGTLHLLWKQRHSRRLLYFAAAPAMTLYAFHNWDLLALFFTVLALGAHARGRPVLAGVAVALGAASKLYPLLLAPALYLDLARTRTPSVRNLLTGRPGRFALAVAGTLFLLHLPFLFLGPDLLLETYRFHARRLPNLETPWFLAHFWAQRVDPEADLLQPLRAALPIVSGLALLGVTAWGGRRLWRGTLDPTSFAFALVLVFLLTNKIFSVQYALWALPFAALVDLRVRHYVAFAAADLAVYATVFPTLGLLRSTGADPASDAVAAQLGLLTAAVVLRHGALAWLLVHALRGTRLNRSPPTAPA